MKKKGLLLIVAWLIHWITLSAQDSRLDSLSQRLAVLNASGVNLNQTISITFDGSLKELIAFLAESGKLNLTAAPGIETQSSAVSFAEAPVRDIILYLCKTHTLDLQFTGTIITFTPYVKPIISPPPPQPKIPDIQYDSLTRLLSLNLQGDTLESVIRQIVSLSGQNISIDPSVRSVRTYGLIAKVELENALKQLASGNYLLLKREAGYFKLEPKFPPNIQDANMNQGTPQPYPATSRGNLQIQRLGADQLAVNATNADILAIIQEAATQLGINYYLLNELTTGLNYNFQNNSGNYNQNQGTTTQQNSWGIISIQIQPVSFRQLLDQLFKNTDFYYKEESGLYILGRRTAESMRDFRIYQFKNRSVRGVMPLIPKDLIYNVQIDSFAEQNSLIMSGSLQTIDGLLRFFNEVDQLVPVVLIDVMLVDVELDRLTDAGLEMGTTPGGVSSGGTIISSTADKGGFNFSLGANAINRLLGLISGKGITNLGQVSPDFYLSLRAVQEEGLINIKSTPKLSTMNSHPATLSIGQTRYYQEQQVNYPGTDRPIPVQSQIFREVEANLDIKITPFVAGDEQVTLNITYEQSEFIGESSVNAPPPRVSRKFESMIRVKNGEMVVLGGLEVDAKITSRRGLPFFSRIPGIGWLFGRFKKSRQKDKILIFVKPTILQ